MRYLTKSTLVFTVLALGCISPALASDVPSFPFLVVSGEAKEEVRPDKATLSLYVTAFDSQSAVASNTVQKQLTALLEVLAAHSVPESAITSFSLSKQVERNRTDRVDTEILGY